ncbi:MAG TPA: transglycosylase domain-containing protein [Acidimicrobiales bacterium]|nr:transglycosylase domain-containing protein [Acidimicrobiales bacterium]
MTTADAWGDATASDGLPDVELSPLAARSEIVAADGTLLDNLYEEDRAPVALADVPQVVVDAVLATEDHAFFDHRGLSVRGLVRALWTNATEGEISEGGSTITKQLV